MYRASIEPFNFLVVPLPEVAKGLGRGNAEEERLQ